MAAQKIRKAKAADALRSIGEAASELGLQTHVLRYWEGKFPKHIKPIKRADGRRMFRPQDVEALRAVQILVHQRGLTLKGAKALLIEQGVEAVLNGNARLIGPIGSVETGSQPESPARELQKVVSDAFGAGVATDAQPVAPTGSDARLKTVLGEITDLKRRLDAVRAQRAA
ncbi:MAG: MerR family transcriptional regulator [Pseudomonadota bacterium]